MAHHDKDLLIAIRRLNELVQRSRATLISTQIINRGISASEVKNRCKVALQELQDNINELENKLSQDPQTVEDTQL